MQIIEKTTDKKNRQEPVNCILCGSSDRVLISNLCRYGISANNVICKRCGLVYISTALKMAKLKLYYDKEYRKQYNIANLESLEYKVAKKVKAYFLSKYIPQRGKILEIGCANGILLGEIRKRREQAELYGIEPTSELAAQARKNFAIDVFEGFFEEYNPGNKKFDFIILEHVLEHFSNPLAMVLKIKGMLNDKGVVYIEVPDIKQPYGDLEHNFFQHVHLFNFSQKTIEILFKLAGFRPLENYLRGALGYFIVKARVFSSKEIDFNREGDDYFLIFNFLENYKKRHRFIKQLIEKNEEIFKDEGVCINDLTQDKFITVFNRIINSSSPEEFKQVIASDLDGNARKILKIINRLIKDRNRKDEYEKIFGNPGR